MAKSRKSKSGYSRPKVKISKGTVHFGAKSPWKGKVHRANPSSKRHNPSKARGAKKIDIKATLATVLPVALGLFGGVAATNLLLNKVAFFTSGWGLKLRGLVHIAVGALGYGYSKNDMVKKAAIGFAASGTVDIVKQTVPGVSTIVGENRTFRMVNGDVAPRAIRQVAGDLAPRSIRQPVVAGIGATGTDAFFS